MRAVMPQVRRDWCDQLLAGARNHHYLQLWRLAA